jgi:hypothetical protein
MENSSLSDNESSHCELVSGVGATSEPLLTIKSHLTISLPPDAASHQMSRSASAPHILEDADELSAFLRVDGADYQQQAISEAGNASLGCLESPTPNDQLAEFDKRSADADATLGRSVNIHNSSLLYACARLS